MSLLINPTIVIQEPKKNKNFGYYITLDKKRADVLKIKKKSYNQRDRGIAGFISKDGEIQADVKVKSLISREIRNKIDFILDTAFGAKRDKMTFSIKNGYIISGNEKH